MVPRIRRATDWIFCHFGPFFVFYPSNKAECQNFENMKKKNAWRYRHFTSAYQKSWYAIPFLRYRAWTNVILFFILHNFLPFYRPNSPTNQNFLKLKKSAWRYHHFTHMYQITWCTVQTNGQKKWYKEMGDPPKNSQIVMLFFRVSSGDKPREIFWGKVTNAKD